MHRQEQRPVTIGKLDRDRHIRGVCVCVQQPAVLGPRIAVTGKLRSRPPEFTRIVTAGSWSSKPSLIDRPRTCRRLFVPPPKERVAVESSRPVRLCAILHMSRYRRPWWSRVPSRSVRCAGAGPPSVLRREVPLPQSGGRAAWRRGRRATAWPPPSTQPSSR